MAKISESCIQLANNKPDKFINQIASAIGNNNGAEGKSNEIKVEKTLIKNNIDDYTSTRLNKIKQQIFYLK